MDIQAICKEAKEAAIKAENDFLESHGEMSYCGFAWVDVYVERSNSKEAKALKEAGFADSWKRKQLCLWTAGNYHGQSMSVKEVGAIAYASVLQKHGIRAHMSCRAD